MYLGIDIGGTTARVCAYSRLDEVEEIGRIEFPVSKDYAHDFWNLVQSCRTLADLNNRIEAVGIATAGQLNAARTSLVMAGNLGHWTGQPIVAKLSEELNCPVVFGNDAEAAAMAEALYGHGRDGDDFWFIVWGTGIGGCLVRFVNGAFKLFPSELGHQRVNPSDDYMCICGQYGCLEIYCGGSGIQRRLGVSAEKLDPGAWEEVVRWMSIGVHNAITSQSTSLVVFGGGIASKQSVLLAQLKLRVKEGLRVAPVPDIKLSPFGETAGTVGALALLASQRY